jgi:mono/diheme cytochrome c family protein
MPWKRILKWGAIGLVGVFLVIQFIPYGRAHDNPPVLAEPAWDSPATRELAQRACFDCHSNETNWPWYTNIAPVSWLATHDVEEGRRALNFSEWGTSGGGHTDEASEVVREGEMPPVYYGWLHSSARLTDAELQQLAAGLDTTLSSGG